MADNYEGFDEPQGPGWWEANDGRWYPPESVPGFETTTAVAERSEESWWRATRGRQRTFLYGAVSVFAVGVVLAVIGLVAGGPDEGKRDDLRARIDRIEEQLAAAEGDLDAAEIAAQAAASGAAGYLDDADEIIDVVIEGCDCGERLTDAMEGVVRAVETATRNPSDATLADLGAALNRTDEETTEFRALLEDVRALMAERAEVPGA